MFPRTNRRISLLIALLLLTLPARLPALAPAPSRSDAQNEKEAKALFNKIYDKVFGKEGSTLSYAVNIIGLYKTQGTITYKGKKLRYQEKRYAAWEDGTTAYMVDKKKRTVNIYRMDDDKKDKYLSKFKYDVNNFRFSYTVEGDCYNITARVKDSKFFGIKYVSAMVKRSSLTPVSMKIKLAFISTTVQITNFKAGGVSDDCFRFPKKNFADYSFTDHRNEEQ
ncbi:MAG: hypothetical protein MJZ43_00980 [Bacteroidaceae bacterium]|nr:hypothetical protein [Candidatus Equimonas faecalis]MCQ2205337.1 hypothetical protein [Bacteroidaceae bacterium]